MTQPDAPREFLELVHDLRSPLTVIRSCAELAEREPALAVERGYLRQLLRNVARLEQLISGVLNRATDQARRPSSLNDILREVLAETLLDGVPPPEMELRETVSGHWDRQQIRRAIVNLLDNAIKYARHGTTVRVIVGRDSDHGFLSIRNHLESEHDLLDPAIFEPFYRGARAKEIRAPGWGLGLAIVRKIAENHGGRIDVEARTPGEVTFVLRLPLSAAD